MPVWDALFNAMRKPRRRRIGPDEVERMLAAGHDPARPELSRLLAAATAPPHPHELAGLDPALAAFEEAGRTRRPVPAKNRWRMLRPLAAATATAAVLVGGVAMAAEVGYLPGTDRPPAHERLGPRDTPPPAPTHASPSPGAGHSSAPPHTSAPPRTPRSESPDPKVADRLCRTWDDRRRKNRPMKPKDLRELSGLAGGEDRIPGYCAPRLGPPGNSPAVPPPPSPPPSASQSAPSTSNDSDDRDEDEDEDDSAAKKPDKRKKHGGPAKPAGPPSSRAH